MRRTHGTVVAFLFSAGFLAANALAAEPDRAAGRAVWGIVTAASAESITIAPESAALRGQKPDEQTFALAKGRTEFAFAEVGMRRLMADGSTLRTITDPEPATAADVQVGQLVQVTPGEGAARFVIIAWSVAGTIVKVDGDSITFRPAGASADADAAADDDDEQLTIGKDVTTVRIAEAGEMRPAPNGRGTVQTIEYKSATIADLKADQSVVVCAKNGTAAKITIHTTAAKASK